MQKVWDWILTLTPQKKIRGSFVKKSTIKHCNACMMSHTCDILQEANENGENF